MADYAHNMTQINFNQSVDNIKGDKVIVEFKKIFGDVEIYNENSDMQNIYGFNADFDSKYSAPIKELTEFIKKFDVSIIGTSTDLDRGYAEAFKLPAEDNKKSRTDIINEIDRLAGDEFETLDDWKSYAKLDTKELLENLEYIQNYSQ